MRKKHTSEFKSKVVLEILKEEKTLAQIAAEFGVHPNQLSKWKKDALELLKSGLEDGRKKKTDREKDTLKNEVHELYAQIGELTSKLNWLKKKSGIDI
jgi:putative transposase